MGLIVVTAAACQVTPGLGTAGGWDHDVSDRADRWGAFRPQAVYRLERDVFLLDVPDRTNGPALVPGMEQDVQPGTFRGPTAVQEYQAAPHLFRGVIGIVTEGTRLRAEALRAKGNLLDPNVTLHYVQGRLMDGEFRGKVVDLQAVSVYWVDPDGGPEMLRGPNEDLLRLE